ncbi:hypothetical protein CHS0354_036319 [Potamilus streckersoni]|uniref:Uncharacterized protein n=1 Tax=Potamilus streckersoni TaxID=2493646 RepID=A0AAE0T7Y9_9BIVA|nr:hypothetical protein CHS0354_036319 [Potamilus streckersoni]
MHGKRKMVTETGRYTEKVYKESETDREIHSHCIKNERQRPRKSVSE